MNAIPIDRKALRESEREGARAGGYQGCSNGQERGIAKLKRTKALSAKVLRSWLATMAAKSPQRGIELQKAEDLEAANSGSGCCLG